MVRLVVLISALLAVAAALPSPVLRKLETERYQYVRGPDGVPHLVDLWVTADDLQESARFNPDVQIIYHLFTRLNPSVSQPLLINNGQLLGATNYSAQRRTIVLIHGWLDNAAADFNTVLVPGSDCPLGMTNSSPNRRTIVLIHGWLDNVAADFNTILVTALDKWLFANAFLAAEDVNVIVVDWSAGAATINYVAAVANTVPAGQGIARFLASLNAATGATLGSYHIVGHSLGGHGAGVVGRNLGGGVAYITALEPLLTGFITNDDKFRSTDGVYTEVIHTNAGMMGYLATLGDADFYPNGGINMPGCNNNDCDHARSYHYFGESVVSSGFLGTRCASYITAMTGNCFLWGGLLMGGTVPKIGSSGIFYLETNAAPPFSRT